MTSGTQPSSRTKSRLMKPLRRITGRYGLLGAAVAACSLMLAAGATGPAAAAGCSFEPQGEGRVAAVIDARTFRLQDGREERLAAIEPAATDTARASRPSAL